MRTQYGDDFHLNQPALSREPRNIDGLADGAVLLEPCADLLG
jgi:hypothetical protein